MHMKFPQFLWNFVWNRTLNVMSKISYEIAYGIYHEISHTKCIMNVENFNFYNDNFNLGLFT